MNCGCFSSLGNTVFACLLGYNFNTVILVLLRKYVAGCVFGTRFQKSLFQIPLFNLFQSAMVCICKTILKTVFLRLSPRWITDSCGFSFLVNVIESRRCWVFMWNYSLFHLGWWGIKVKLIILLQIGTKFLICFSWDSEYLISRHTDLIYFTLDK